MSDLDGTGGTLSTAAAEMHSGCAGKRPYAPPCVKRLGGTNRGTADGVATWVSENQRTQTSSLQFGTGS